MKEVRKKQLTRWVVSADGQVIGHAETEQKARIMAGNYTEGCWNQDEPYYPKMKIKMEILEEG